MLNVADLMGRLAADPEIHESVKKDGKLTVVARWRMAVDSDFQGGDPAFIQIKAFGSTAEFIKKYVRKGDLIVISGRIVVESYEKDGEKIYSTLVYANRVYLARKKQALPAEGYPDRKLQPGKDLTGGQAPEQETAPDHEQVCMDEFMPDMPELPEDMIP